MIVPQPTRRPTNKLTSAVLAVAIVEVARVITTHFLPDFADPTMWAAVTQVIVYLAGYVVHDEDNSPADTATPEPSK